MDGLISSIMGWGANFAPRNWAFCQGQLLAISQNTALFSLIGTLYGGDGRTSFSLPELRGRVPVGAGQSPGTTYYKQGAMLGTESVTLTEAEMPMHNHPASFQSTGASLQAATDVADASTPGNGDFLGQSDAGLSTASNIYYTGVPSGTASLSGLNATGNVTIGNAGGGMPFGILQPLQAIQFIICMQGVYPSRN